jgi:hypothetical protein
MNFIPIKEKLKHFELDIHSENIRLYNFLIEYRTNLDFIIDYYFLKFDIRGLCKDYNEFMKECFFEPIDNALNEENEYLIQADFFLNVKYFVTSILSEYDKSIVNSYFTYELKKDLHIMHERVLHILSLIGYKTEIKDEYVHIIKSNINAEIVAEKVEDDNVKWKILEFNKYDIRIEEKINILEDMYKEFEKIRSKSIPTIANKIAKYMNTGGIRHKIDDKIDEKVIKYIKENPSIYDVIYELMIECFLHVDNLEAIEKIEKSLK